jgi:hypothetical protein
VLTWPDSRAARLQMFHGQVMQMLYGGSPNVSFFKGDGEPQLGPVLDMPDNSSSGAVRQSFTISLTSED